MNISSPKAKWPCRGGMLAGVSLTLALTACGSKDDGQLGSVYVKSGLIRAAEGGELEVPLLDGSGIGGAKIVVPAQSLAADTTITIGIGEESIAGDLGTGLGPVIEFGPAGTGFSKPAIVTIPYSGTVERDRLRVFVKQADGTRSVIPAHQIALDPVRKLVRFQVEHFTQFQCGNGMTPQPCQVADCGPPLGLPNWTCADGSVGGPTGQCLRNDDGTCGWEVNWCEPGCTATECGPAPMLDLICPDGSSATTECVRDPMGGTCGWSVHCPDTCPTPVPGTGGMGGTGGDAAPVQGCMTDADCGPGLTCQNFICLPPPCMSDADCPMGQVCAMGSCYDPNPQPPPPTCTGCENINCPDGTVCQNGMCVPVSQSCGGTMCGMGEYCCNESCGICAPLGAACTQQACVPNCNGVPCPPGSTCDAMTGTCSVPTGEVCGNNLCGPGEYCCNESCGVCAPQGAACTQEICPSCGMGTTCPPGQTCGADGSCTAECDPAQCGPAPGVPNWTCDDGTVGGPTGRCIPAGSSMLPPPGGMGGGAPTPAPSCVWEINWCTPGCSPMECGPQPALPNYTCPDGMTIAGPTGQCLRAADGSCGWEIIQCP